jgi:hypothetical protein
VSSTSGKTLAIALDWCLAWQMTRNADIGFEEFAGKGPGRLCPGPAKEDLGHGHNWPAQAYRRNPSSSSKTLGFC